MKVTMERALEKSRQSGDIAEFITYANTDRSAEFEVKVLAGRIQTKDVADRILKSIRKVAARTSEEHRLTYNYPNNIRVHVVGVDNIHKVCVTKSFKGIPLNVERKMRYFESVDRGEGPGETKLENRDRIEVPEYFCSFTLKTEKHIKNDFDGNVDDPAAYIRMIHRQSFYLPGDEIRIDFSMVKTKSKSTKQGIREVLKNVPTYELEVEYTPRAEPRDAAEVRPALIRTLEMLLGAYQESPFVLSLTDMQRYEQEFKKSGNRFYNLVTLEFRHVMRERPHNILKGYTVTNKADGIRCGLYVARDKRVIRVTKTHVAYTGLITTDDAHIEDFLDGEYLPEKNLFCIFDVYRYKGRDVKSLPLFTTDDDVKKHPLTSRLGCARDFVHEMNTSFVPAGDNTIRVETKLFLAGDGAAMEEAIQKMLDTEFEYETDGLIFTPRSSPVAPPADTKGSVWMRVYKWKPPHQNSIDFLLRFDETPTYDVNLKQMVKVGSLYVSRTPGTDIVNPCETMTGEYVAPKLPTDLWRLADSGTRVPSVFQPSAPKDSDAYVIRLPLNDKNIPMDLFGNKIENNTVVECTYDVDKQSWSVMRTRYDKTFEYRVLRLPQYGNDIYTADSIWTSIHTPITEKMLREIYTAPPDDTIEDDAYYRDDIDSRDRILKWVYAFHNRVKDTLYKMYVVRGNTLMEIAVGLAGDLHKWIKAKPSKVLGLDMSQTNLTMPRRGACARYLKEKMQSSEPLPKVLFAQCDMTKPFEEQESPYLKLVFGDEPASTPYLAEFKGIKEWDLAACQFAIHYACESEETFRAFVGNLSHCKSVFFGTCMDGKSVYSLLAGKDRHTFRKNKQTFAEITKKYEDSGEWKEEFGQQVDVLLETIVKPTPEYLVPFDRVQEILGEAGFELIESNPFEDEYTKQQEFTFSRPEQEFSFLYRTFAFRRISVPLKEEAPVEEVMPEIVEQPPAEEVAEVAEVAPTEEKKVVVRRKRIVKPVVEEALPEIMFFFSKDPENKEFSNFYETVFQVDDVEYKSAEHAYQAIKAHTFGDNVHFEKIRNAKSAQSAKSFGKKVENFKEDIWNAKKDDVMKQVLRAKFTQNLELRKKLLDTEDKLLAQADARDKYWGIGTSAPTSIAKDPKKWKGENKLGKILMEIRTELKAEGV